MKNVTKSITTGSISGLLGALCCVTPLVLVLVGLSGVSGAAALSGTLQQNFRWTLFIPLATIFLVLALYFQLKKKEGVCNLNTIKKYKWFVLTTVLFAVIIWVLLIYAIVPAIFSLLS